jgi:hypothetical protein
LATVNEGVMKAESETNTNEFVSFFGNVARNAITADDADEVGNI